MAIAIFWVYSIFSNLRKFDWDLRSKHVQVMYKYVLPFKKKELTIFSSRWALKSVGSFFYLWEKKIA